MIPEKESKRPRERWTPEEHELFLEGLKKYNRDWRAVERMSPFLAPICGNDKAVGSVMSSNGSGNQSFRSSRKKMTAKDIKSSNTVSRATAAKFEE
jgi:hypothetical protein